MGLVYIDTSAWAKLLQPESESAAFVEYLEDCERLGDRLISSVLLQIETSRILARDGRDPSGVGGLMRGVTLLGLGTDIVDLACRITSALEAMDAVHLSTALALAEPEEGDEEWLTTFVTYDVRLAEAARERGLEVVSPGAG